MTYTTPWRLTGNRVGGLYLYSLAGLHVVGGLFQFKYRTGALQSAGINGKRCTAVAALTARSATARTRRVVAVIVAVGTLKVLCGQLISLVAARKVAHFVAVGHKYACGDVASETYGAECYYGLALVYLAHVLADVVYGNVDGPADCAEAEFGRCTGVDNLNLAAVETVDVAPVDNRHLAGYDVGSCITSNGYRIFGRRERRSISLLKADKVVDGALCLMIMASWSMRLSTPSCPTHCAP